MPNMDPESVVDRILALKEKFNDLANQHMREVSTPDDGGAGFSELMTAMTQVMGERIWIECRDEAKLMQGIEMAANHMLHGARDIANAEGPAPVQRTN